ncbi:MAG: hypothetical protein WCG47_29025 [Dermatophilaceae bacterium]
MALAGQIEHGQTGSAAGAAAALVIDDTPATPPVSESNAATAVINQTRSQDRPERTDAFKS